MNNTEIALLVGFIISSILLALYILYLVFNSNKYLKKDTKLTTSTKKFVYIFFNKWFKIFMLFTLSLIVFFCLSMFIVEMLK
ncbi:hypothetical protein SLITO_v1c06970 [Spiroplasma litorale]|uniref:Uncharacterized protein n=1 Tax=Spiroplasma litorale TaxID=216942 RepID=A0A0K1W1Y7_9MOLU|nr:hypothetical protein SLITO_v1c06970 [Spiroplasma litorale]